MKRPLAPIRCGATPQRSSVWQAFTLVELLVVIGFLGILTTLSLGGLSRAKTCALSARCKSNLHQLSLALAFYVTEQNSYPLFDYIDGVEWHSWPELIALGSRQMARPSQGGSILECPAGFKKATQPVFYGYTDQGYAFQGLGRKMELEAGVWHVGAVRESEVQRPVATLALGDGIARLRSGALINAGISLERWRLWNPPADPGTAIPSDYMAEDRLIRSLHANQVNVSYCDGHVEASSLELLFDGLSDEALCRWNRDQLPHRECLIR